jgi:Tfp pilus assembly protein PilO
MTTPARIIIAALAVALIAATGYAFILHRETADARAELNALEYEVERERIAAETALFATIQAHRNAIAEKDAQIEALTRRDAELAGRIASLKHANDETRMEILDLDSAGVGRELRGVFARRGHYP